MLYNKRTHHGCQENQSLNQTKLNTTNHQLPIFFRFTGNVNQIFFQAFNGTMRLGDFIRDNHTCGGCRFVEYGSFYVKNNVTKQALVVCGYGWQVCIWWSNKSQNACLTILFLSPHIFIYIRSQHLKWNQTISKTWFVTHILCVMCLYERLSFHKQHQLRQQRHWSKMKMAGGNINCSLLTSY